MYILELFKLGILTPARIARLSMHVLRHGVQLINVVHMCGDKHATALIHRGKSLTYDELFGSVASVSGYLRDTYQVREGNSVLIVADNSTPSVVLLFALSALGCHIHVCSPQKDYERFSSLSRSSAYDFIFSATETRPDYEDALLLHIAQEWDQAVNHKGYKSFVKRFTRISTFTSGSTGVPKNSPRSNTLWQYLRVISDLVKTLKLQEYRSVLLPVPIYHSYGLSTLFLSLMLNKTVVLVNKFDVADVVKEINSNTVEAAVFVPQMINRLLPFDLPSLQCIISCADVLPVRVLRDARQKFGEIIFNLYGTSETGLATIATPEMLAMRPDTIGRPLKGCRLRLEQEKGINVLHAASGFAIGDGFIRTGDIASVDEHGWYYLHGRADDMIVVNGVNVYPNELIQMALQHEGIRYARAKAFINEDGFRRIKMTISISAERNIDEFSFKQWWVSKYGSTLLPTTVVFTTDDREFKLMAID